MEANQGQTSGGGKGASSPLDPKEVVLQGLLIEFHHHEEKRIPGIATQLVSLCAAASAAGEHNDELEIPHGFPNTPRSQSFLAQLKEQFGQEIQKLNAMEAEHRDKWHRTLQVHASDGRLVTMSEVETHTSSLKRKFDGVRYNLKLAYDKWLRSVFASPLQPSAALSSQEASSASSPIGAVPNAVPPPPPAPTDDSGRELSPTPTAPDPRASPLSPLAHGSSSSTHYAPSSSAPYASSTSPGPAKPPPPTPPAPQ